jgi:hypothetical protein
MVQIIVILASSFFYFSFQIHFMYLNKVTREIDWPSFLKLFYIFGHETHLFDNHLYMYLKYTVFRGKIIPVFIN